MNGASRCARIFARSSALTCVAALSLAPFAGCARQHVGRVEHDDDDAIAPADEATSDDPMVSAPVDATGERAARRPDGGQGVSVREPSISALLNDVFTAYQLDNGMRCPCQVASGVYASLDECEELNARAHPRIEDCLDGAIPAESAPSVRAWVSCLLRAVNAHLDCIEDASCDAQSDCRLDSAGCAFPDPVVLSNALSQCPRAISPPTLGL